MAEKIEVTMKNGQLVIDRQRVNIKQDTGKVKLVNSAGVTVYWFVPYGPFKGGGFHTAVPGSKTTREAERHDADTEYTHRIALTPESRLRKHGPKSDPIIIIDVSRRKKARRRR